MTTEIEASTPRDDLSWRATSLLLEIVLGTWLLVLFVIALAWDPIDRRLGFRMRRLATRAATQRSVVDMRQISRTMP
jgi:uncharacterized membrane protein